MRTSELFSAKNLGFFEIYGVSAQTRGLRQCGHFADERESFFRFCADVFYGWPLICILFSFKIMHFDKRKSTTVQCTLLPY